MSIDSSRNPDTTTRRRGKKTDLSIPRLPDLEPGMQICETRLQVFRWLETIGIETYHWYVSEKQSKSRISKTIRIFAVAMLTIGGVLPLLALISHGEIPGEWGFVALAVGAGALLLDRAFGFSTSWARYSTAAMELRARLLRAQIGWTQSTATDAQAETAQNQCIIDLAESISSIVRDETTQWSRDFEEHLLELQATIGSHPR